VVCLAVFSAACERGTRPERAANSPTKQSLLKGFLVLDRLVCNLAGVVGRVARWRMRVRVVLGEDARAIVDGKDEDGRHAEEGDRARHDVWWAYAAYTRCRRRKVLGGVLGGREVSPPPRVAEQAPITGPLGAAKQKVQHHHGPVEAASPPRIPPAPPVPCLALKCPRCRCPGRRWPRSAAPRRPSWPRASSARPPTSPSCPHDARHPSPVCSGRRTRRRLARSLGDSSRYGLSTSTSPPTSPATRDTLRPQSHLRLRRR